MPQSSGAAGQRSPQNRLPWREWTAQFPQYVTAPFAPHHEQAWDWAEAVQPGQWCDPFGLWLARGGGKSTTIELIVSYLADTQRRKFVLFVSNTQAQASDHLSGIAGHLEILGIGRKLNPYGQPKGWRADRLRADNDFNAAALGLDTASRGIKLDEFRPDLIVLDDFDAVLDSPLTVEKKIVTITQSILPTLSAHGIVFVCQNMIHEDSIASRIATGKADFLKGMIQTDVVPAAYDLEIESYDRGDGQKVHRAVAGTPTWEGQNLSVITRQLNTMGLRAFLREAQHEVEGTDGLFFDVSQFVMVDELPKDFSMWRKVRAWDLAATRGGGDFTVGLLMAKHPTKAVYIVADVVRGQWSSEQVRKAIAETAIEDRRRFGKVSLRLPQDPGQAGKAQADQFKQAFAHLTHELIVKVTGEKGKAARAEGQQEAVNLGNVQMLKAAWNHAVKRVYRLFREDMDHEHDDDVDAGSDAFNELAKSKATKKGHSYEAA